MRDAILWTTTYLEGVDKSGSSRIDRTNKFLDFYMPLQKELGFSKIVLLDNASSPEQIQKLKWVNDSSIIHMSRFDEALYKSGERWYPYLWRALYFIRTFILHSNPSPKKLIYIDTDTFVLSKRMAEWIRTQETGWNTVWCKRYQFPEASVHVLNEPSYPEFLKFTEGDYLSHCGKEMERVLPFSSVNKELNCDRFGETGDPVTPGMDLYSQASVKMPMKYGEW